MTRPSPSARVALGAAALASTLALPTFAAPGPRARLADAAESGRHLVLSELPAILDAEEVRPHLRTGLTTSLLFRVQLRDTDGRKVQGGARVEIRYELWDEIFQTAVLDARGKVHRHDLASFEELAKWWSELRLVVLTGLATSGTDPPAGIHLGADPCRVFVDVVPFSRAERDDTRRWFSESIDEAGHSPAEDVASSADERPETLSRTFNVLMAMSIEQRPIHTFRYTLGVEPFGVEP